MSDKMFSCDDGCLATAIAHINASKKIEILGISKILGMGNAEYNKKLFNMEFDEIKSFNSFSGIGFIAVKKNNLWGLIRLRRIDGKKFHQKNNFINDILNEPYDEKDLEPFNREVKMIEKPLNIDLNTLIDRYYINKIEWLSVFLLP